MHRLLLLLILLPFFVGNHLAAEDIDPGPAVDAAQDWVHQVDAGNYEKMYSQGASVFQQRVSPAQWTLVLKTIRSPLGRVTDRKLLSHTYHPNGYEGVDGEWMAIIFETSFEKAGVYLENVALRKEGGQWRPAGYIAEPKAAQSSPP